jgi:hypothetical protein
LNFHANQAESYLTPTTPLTVPTHNGWTYANSAIAWFNISLWTLAIPLINMDKRLSIEVRCIIKDILQYYPTIKQFLTTENDNSTETILKIYTPVDYQQNLDTRVEEEYYKLSMHKSLYQNLLCRHKQFVATVKLLNTEFTKEVSIYKTVSYKFVLKQLIEPPTLLSLFGLIGAMILEVHIQ